jgi:outer membrane protein
LTFKANVITQVITVISAYYQLVQAYNSLEVNELSLRDEQNTLNQTQAKIKVGKSAPTEQIQQQLTIANSQLSISQNQNAILQSQYNLLNLLGLDPSASIIIDKKINYATNPIPNLASCIDIATQHNTDYQSALLAYKITERSLLVAQDQQKWQLNAVGQLTQPLTSSGSVSGTNSRSLTLNSISLSMMSCANNN